MSFPWSPGPTKPHPSHRGYLVIEHKDKNSLWYINDKDYAEILPEFFPTEVDVPISGEESTFYEEEVPYITIPEDIISWSWHNRSVATCTFNGTKDYMKHIFGMELDEDDRNWFSNYNNKVTNHGCRGDWFLTVVNQLVEPYNLGVSRVRVKTGSMRYEEQAAFIKSLGANPFFVLDGTTTNAEALEKMGVEPDSIVGRNLLSQWRFDCEDEPLKPSINTTQFNMEEVGGHTGATSYIGPRNRRNETMMCVQLDRLDRITYLAPLELSPYEAHPGEKKPVIGSIRLPTGNTLSEEDRKRREAKKLVFKPSFPQPPKKEPEVFIPQDLGDVDDDVILPLFKGTKQQDTVEVCVHCRNELVTSSNFHDGTTRCMICNNVVPVERNL